MELHPSLADRLGRLAPDQRAAAMAPPGPSLCIAPAGSGKTTTLVARAAWLIATGTPAEAIRAITFNKRAAVEMTDRLDAAVAPLGIAAGAVRVRTFHALGREILRDAGVEVEPLADRPAILAEVAPWADEAALLRLDTIVSRLKVELGVSAADVAADPEAGPMARAFVAYEAAVAASGGLDFDDLILRAIAALEGDPALLARWRAHCRELLVDEVQDVDRAQLRLALLLAAPANRIFLVGDDDQSIYGWRLADVRRILGLAARLPGLRRVDLEVNYRCPRQVVERAVRLVEHNGERFAKTIRPGPAATGRLVLAPDPSDETVRLERAIRTWPDDGSTRAVLARTNRELLPAIVVALRLGLPFRAPRIDLLVDSPVVDTLLERAAADAHQRDHLLVTLGRVRDGCAGDRDAAELATALLGWAVGFADLAAFVAAIHETRLRLADLRRDDAAAHAGDRPRDEGPRIRPRRRRRDGESAASRARGPSARPRTSPSLRGGTPARVRRVDPRARRSLTLLYDPAVPSPFLLEAFSPDELGLSPAIG